MALTVAHTTSTAQANNPAYDISANAWNGTSAHTIVSTPLNFTDLNTLEQYNSTTGQTLNIYNTRTDASNYERLSIAWSANAATISTAALGTGTVRDLHFGSSSGGDLYLDISATNFIFFGKPGNHFFNIDGSTGSMSGSAQTVAASAPVLNLSQTWNNAGVTFTGLKLNVTSTASAAGSLLLDLQVATVSKFSVDKTGAITGQNFTSTAQGLVPASGGGTTNFLRADGTWAAAGGGSPVGSSGQFQYDNAGAFGGANEWFISANVIAQGNGVNAQARYIYNTVDTIATPTNFERLNITWSALGSTAWIHNDYGGTGAFRTLNLGGHPSLGGSSNTNIYCGTTGVILVQGPGSAGINLGSVAINGWNIDQNGHLVAFGSNARDIGNATYQIRTVYHYTTALTGVTVASLPTAVAGMVAYVTDGAASLAWGATVTGGSTTKYLVFYNGTNWTVAGK